jgi:hypothetical protein
VTEQFYLVNQTRRKKNRATYRIEKDIGRLEIAVDDLGLVAVEEGEALGRPERDLHPQVP